MSSSNPRSEWRKNTKNCVRLWYILWYRCLIHVIMHLRDYAYSSEEREKEKLCYEFSYFDPAVWFFDPVYRGARHSWAIFVNLTFFWFLMWLIVYQEFLLSALNGRSRVVMTTVFLRKRERFFLDFQQKCFEPINIENENFVIYQSIEAQNMSRLFCVNN